MTTKQPAWNLVTNLGDRDFANCGGTLVYIDKTGVYPPEAEYLEAETGEVWRWILDQCTYKDGVLSDNSYHPEHPAWFAGKIDGLASYAGLTPDKIREAFCSANPIVRARVYELLGHYAGFDNLDSYPLRLSRQKVGLRYGHVYRFGR